MLHSCSCVLFSMHVAADLLVQRYRYKIMRKPPRFSYAAQDTAEHPVHAQMLQGSRLEARLQSRLRQQQVLRHQSRSMCIPG
jgi:hypothetical protein